MCIFRKKPANDKKSSDQYPSYRIKEVKYIDRSEFIPEKSEWKYSNGSKFGRFYCTYLSIHPEHTYPTLETAQTALKEYMDQQPIGVNIHSSK